jgi:hypothetical protein
VPVTNGAVPSSSSTLVDLATDRRGWAARRSGLLAGLAFGLIVLVALSGLLGVRTRTTSTELADGTTVAVHYGWITRPGLATPWSVTVRRPGGFDGPIIVRSTRAYFDMFDENGLTPDPTSATQDGETVIWEFDPPPGDTLVVSFDARIEPAKQWGRDATTEVEVAGVSGAVTYHTWVLP